MTDQQDRERESRESPVTKFDEIRLEEESEREEAAKRVRDGSEPGPPTDEDQIRDVVAAWHRATEAGDLEAVLPLMAEDVVFLTTGRAPMRGREAFAEGFRNVLAEARIESTGEIQEVGVADDLAYCWTDLTVTTIPESGERQERTGPTLTIFTRQADGRWVVSRDANLLPPLA
jgi:uncharacterized protein (TIGR02246 family)